MKIFTLTTNYPINDTLDTQVMNTWDSIIMTIKDMIDTHDDQNDLLEQIPDTEKEFSMDGEEIRMVIQIHQI